MKKEYKNLNKLYEGIDFGKKPFNLSWGAYSWSRDPMLRKVAEFLVPGNVLDDGGGFGYFEMFVPNHNYYNLDISPAMLKHCRAKNKILGSGENLPFGDETFDNVVSIGVLRHVIDEQAYLDEAVRVLKPGGRFVLATPREGWLFSFLKTWLFWTTLLYFIWYLTHRLKVVMKKEKPSLKIPNRMYSEKWLGEQLKKRGLKVLYQTRCTKDLPGIEWRWFSEKFVDAEKYGRFSFFVCKKPN